MLKAFADIKKNEIGLAVSMWFYFFLVITCFWILKPLKKGMFIEYYDEFGWDFLTWHFSAPQTELFAKILNLAVALLALAAFTKLSSRYRRHHLTWIWCGCFGICIFAYAFLLASQNSAMVWSFYLFGDLFSTVMVATFFAFMNDVVTPSAARRLYGIIGLGGVTGGVFGTTVVRIWVDQMAPQQWMWVCLIVVCFIGVAAAIAGMQARKAFPMTSIPLEGLRGPEEKNSLIQNLVAILKNKYILSIIGIVTIYEMVSTIMDFQFSFTVAHFLNGSDIGKHFSTVYALTNWVSFGVQLFLTGFVMNRLGVKVALLVLPVLICAGSMGFAFLPLLWSGSFLSVIDNGFNYSINQSAKESLYVPLNSTQKYQAKGVVDIFMMRTAKVVAIGLSLVLSQLFLSFELIRWLSLITIPLGIGWFFLARSAGKNFQKMTEPEGSVQEPIEFQEEKTAV